MSQPDYAMERLEDQINWYGKKSAYNQRMFKGMKTVTIVVSLLIPLFAAFAAYKGNIDGKLVALIAGILGALIALLEAVQQLNQYHHNWITYRSTAEALKHEKYLYLSHAGPYAAADIVKALLAERVESSVSQEHAKWASSQEQTRKTENPKSQRRPPGDDDQIAIADDELEEDVSSSVYAPRQTSRGNSFLVQVFAHLAEQADALDEIAREADEDARRRISAQLKKTIKRGAVLTFNLSMPGLEIDAPAQSCVWSGQPALVQFGVTVPQDCEPKDIIGLVIVCENSVPIGHLRFKLKIVDNALPPASVPAHVGIASRYQQAFISYASPDRPEVLKRVQILNSLKLKFFHDLLSLEPGDRWEKLIYQYIDQSDVFFLFWSQAASESPWVIKEIQYAMQRKGRNEEGPPEIVPVIIEGPPPAKPPSELNFLHFNDKFIYFINTSQSGK